MNILIVGILFFSKSFASLFLKPEALQYYSLLLIFILLNNPVFLIEYLLLIKEQTISLVLYGILNFIFQVSIVVIPLWLGYDLSISLIGLIILSSFKLLFLGYLLMKHTEIRTDVIIWKEHIYYSLPLILSLLLSGSAEYIDGALVSSHFGPEAFAIFRYGAKELPISMLLANAMSVALVPRLSGNLLLKDGLDQLKKESTKLMRLLFPITFVLLISSHWLYPLVFRTDFQESAGIFNIYLLLVISRVLFPQTVILALQRTEVILKVAIFEIIINIIASYFLMLKFGMVGVAFGTIIAFFSEKLLLILVLHKKEQIPISKYLNIKEWTFCSLALLICYYFVENFLY